MLTMNVDRETFETVADGRREMIQKAASPFWIRRIGKIVGIDPKEHNVEAIMRTAGRYKNKSLKFRDLVLRCGSGHSPESDTARISGFAYIRRPAKDSRETIWLVITDREVARV